MNKMSDFECKKSFRPESHAGITFHWLKRTFGDGLENAVRDAIRVVYYPSAIAFFSNSTDRDKVIAALEQSRMTFDRWMNLAQEIKPVANQSPKRVLIEFVLSVDGSGAGVALDWLLNHQGNAEKKILDAVLWLYLPVAFCAFGETNRRLVIMRSLTNFSQRMDLPGYPAPIDDISSFKPSLCLATPQDAAVVFHQLKNTLAVKDMPAEEMANSNEMETSDTEEKSEEPEKPDDTPEIDYDFDF
jgi:intracellular sulfur oxidation DsrE/DsrF family protein